MSSLSRVFVSKNDIYGDTVLIRGSDASHLTKVMRLGIGDMIQVCDMQRCEYSGKIIGVSKNDVTVKLSGKKVIDTELPFNITVYQALVKGDKFDTVVQKSVELGATSIVPVMCERCIVKYDKKSDKIERYNKIAQSAAAQCGRGIVPLVREPVTFERAIDELSDADCNNGCAFLCYEGDGTVFIGDFIKKKYKCESYSLIIGPE